MEGRNNHVIKMAALGRQFKLGGLYDYLNDRVMRDSPEWKQTDLLELKNQVKSEFEMKMVITESDSGKWEQMGFDEHLKSSTLAGLIDKCHGASSYLNDQNYPDQVSQTVVIRIKTKEENLDLLLFPDLKSGEKHHTDTPNKFVDAKERRAKNIGKKKENSITKLEVDAHVIVGIVYGAEIYCVLTQELADEADEDAKDDATTSLADWAGQMESALEDNRSLSQFKEDFEKEERQQLIRMKCRVYADIQSKSFRECGFFDAYKFCLKVIEQTQKTGIKNKAVPIVYKLCPLKIVTNSVEAARDPTESREVNADLLAQCYDIWSQLEKIIARAKALISSSKKVNGPPLRQFITFIEKYQKWMRNRMQAGVLKARKSTDDDEDDVDEEFEKIIKIVENHLYFKPASLEKWLCYKTAEAEMIKDIAKLKDITFAVTADQLKKQLTESFDKKYTLVLQIPELDERTNEILKKMRQTTNEIKLMAAIGDDEENYECDEDDDLPWYMIPSKRKQLMDKFREFSDYAAKNQETECQFLITLGDKKNGFQYSIYETDQVLKDNVQLPGPPTDLKVQLERVNEKTKSVKIQLKWKYKEIDYPHQFLVEYRPKDSLDSWKQQNTSKPGQKQVSITCKRDSMLEFRVAADTCIGRSQFSTILDMEPSFHIKASFDDDDDSVDQEFIYSSDSTLNLSKLRPNYINKRSTKTIEENYEDSDGESELNSVSKTMWNNKKSEGQIAKIGTNGLFQSKSTPGNRTNYFISDNKMIGIGSQVKFIQTLDSSQFSAFTCIKRSFLSKIYEMESASCDGGDEDDDQESVNSSLTHSFHKTISNTMFLTFNLTNKQYFETFINDRIDNHCAIGMIRFNQIQTTILPPKGLVATLVTKNMAEISWLPSKQSTDDEDVSNMKYSYIVSYSQLDSNTSVEIPVGFETECRLENLQDETEYLVHVEAQSEEGERSAPCKTLRIKTFNKETRIVEAIAIYCKDRKHVNGMDLLTIPLTKRIEPQTTFERYYFGKSKVDQQVKHKTILLLGATNTGKSTLINTMINYILGVEWEDNFRFQMIPSTPTGSSQNKSHTNKIAVYKISHMEEYRIPYSLTIIDTPGYGDNEGLDQDRKTTKMIRELFEEKDGIKEINLIGFVAQASLPRLTLTQRYIFDSVLSIFGKDVKENIRFLLTFADSKTPAVLTAIEAARLPFPIIDENGKPLYHKFNNTAFFCSNRNQHINYETGFRPVGTLNKLHHVLWGMGISNFKSFFLFLDNIKPNFLSMTKEVLKERKLLEERVDYLLNQGKRILNSVKVITFSNTEEQRTLQKYAEIREKIKTDQLRIFEHISNIIHKLDEIALHPNPFPSLQYIGWIIDTEHQEQRNGFKDRIETLKSVQKLVNTMNEIRNQKNETNELEIKFKHKYLRDNSDTDDENHYYDEQQLYLFQNPFDQSSNLFGV